MATTRFNSIILAAARRLKAARTDPTAAGDLANSKYTSALLSEYTNRAIRELLLDLFQQYHEKFGDYIPEYVKTSSNIALNSGVGSLPSDCFLALDLSKSDRSVKFFKLSSKQVEDIRDGQDGMIVPSATRPAFWIEGRTIYTLGLTSGNVILRYIKSHQDISPTTAAVNNGTIYTTAANLSWDASEKKLTIDGELHIFDTNIPTNAIIQFWIAGTVYTGRVSSYHITIGGDAEVYIDGEALPAGDINPSNLLGLAISGLGPDASDLTLDNNWVSKVLIDRVVQLGQADAKAGIL